MTLPFIDLQSQYQSYKEEIDSAFKAEFIAPSLLKQKKLTAINNN